MLMIIQSSFPIPIPTQTFVTLFCNLSSSFFLIFIFFHFTSIFLAKLFIFFGGNPFFQRNQDGYEFAAFSDEEVEGEEEENDYYAVKPVAFVNQHATFDEEVLVGDGDSEESGYATAASEASTYEDDDDDDDDEEEEEEEEEIIARDTDSSSYDSETNEIGSTSGFRDTSFMPSNNDINHIHQVPAEKHGQRQAAAASDLREEEKYLVFQPAAAELGKKLVREDDEREMFGDSFTIGSTSKDSSEWRSSIHCRDSATEDPFSSSSRRSCPKWESYAVFHKYDEEMLFLDRISAQKLSETESLRSIQACPRSISERIAHKIRTRSQRSTEYRQNPYRELESAYVAQICLTWEALNWNYSYFQRLRASRREFDPGCPAYVAQQFQQFQVLLQRYVENEPYEHGRRPDIYARMRSLAPKLLQVPEYRDSEDPEKKEEGSGSRIPSGSFLQIMEESIRTFMDFLKQDKKNHYQILADLFKRNRKGSADATLLLLLKKVNKKKKAKLQELRRSGKCLRKRKLKAEEEIAILMAQIDLKIVSRVLRMGVLNGDQLHWCENKMTKVRVSDGKLQRDSSPLFFPAH
ncbi:uncharacterized protein LOC125212253 [Salvia hispanica]|uniref:uncharacterized protein LOC125212253 n=1 Tax=Salvia hispanica TaxID=49212 RepID=UPI0020095847|nr:uncharacterized protein LOC125212253 [Salvia hispanica]